MKLLCVAAVLLSACLMPPQGGASSSSTMASSSSPSGSAPSEAPPPPGAATPAPAGPVSVTIRSACSKTVKVFYGDKPKFGSGTYSSIESNSVQSHSFRPGEMLWVVDDSENGVGSVQIGQGTRELEIQSSCTSIASR